ncbi:acetylglutamate kinase [Rhodothalassium salexigens]|nr:acetylglutamate kinase [Rhodothalassium salexigens]MBB4210930.1 acetylglutamate kinase [Rhodothalassium salexigens DSM 2132]
MESDLPHMAHPEATLRLAKWKSGVLAEALPFMRRYAGSTFVVKYGGHAMGDARAARHFAEDVVLLRRVGINVVVVHGGGPQIGAMLQRLKIQSEFVDGLRVTSAEIVDVVEMVLSGAINKSVVAGISAAGGKAVGLSGKDGAFVTARKLRRTKRDPDSQIERVLDLGYVGEPTHVDASFLRHFMQSDLIPVIAPIGLGADGETFNINADTMAGAVAAALDADRLLLLTDVKGVLNGAGELLPELDAGHAAEMIADGTISGGMVPKVETCLKATREGVGAAVILDGRALHALLLEIFTEAGAGTLIR